MFAPLHANRKKTYPIFIFDLSLQLCVGLSLLLQLILEELHLVHQRLFLIVQLSAAHHGSLVLVFQSPKFHLQVPVLGGEAVACTFTGFITTLSWPRCSCGYLLPRLEKQQWMGECLKKVYSNGLHCLQNCVYMLHFSYINIFLVLLFITVQSSSQPVSSNTFALVWPHHTCSCHFNHCFRYEQERQKHGLR